MRCRGDADDSPVTLGADTTGLKEATGRLEQLWAQLQRLQKAGLAKQAAAALLRAYAGPASQFPLQLEQASLNHVAEYDAVLLACWQDLADRDFTQQASMRVSLPTRLGGCGAQLAATRCHAAYWCGWTAVVKEVAEELGCASLADLLDSCPKLAQQLTAARTALTVQGMPLAAGAPLAEALRTSYPQRLLVGRVQKKRQTALLQSLPPPQAADLQGTGGPGAAGFLQYPCDAQCSLEDASGAAA